MRPLTQAHIDTMGPTRVVVSENNNGVEKSWFYTSTASAGAAYGLIGVLVTATMDAIINAGPSARAQKAANEIAELVSIATLNASLIEHLNQQTATATADATAAASATDAEAHAIPASATDSAVAADAPVEATASGVSYSGVESAQRLMERDALDDAVELSVRYTLSEDSSTLRVIAQATYQSAQTPYATPYQFASSPPRAEREGPAYRNTFTYYSTQLPVPTLTPELRERLIASIQDSARDANGALPVEGSNEYQAMQRELENARDDRLSKDEIAIFLTREWLRDDGAMLRREIEQAHAFIARYVLLDMNRPIAPNLAGQDEPLETMAEARTVRRVGAGTDAGSYVSSAGNVTSFSTYGNTIGIARAHRERIESIRSASRRQSR
ncbi:MAG: hypothetical protein ACT4OF_09085 [Caulobacteraceae bacterium]